MNPESTYAALTALAGLARTPDARLDDVLDAALPIVRAATGAAAVLLEAPAAGEAELPAVPPEWAELGITRVHRHALPAGAGTLLLAEPAGAALDPPALGTALAVLDVVVARLGAEERLTDLRARVDNAQQLANMGDYDWHIATDTNQWSDQLYRIYGHRPQEFNASYERFLSHIHPDDRERIAAIHRHSYETGEPYEMIERIVRPDGSVRYLASNGQVVLDDGGTPVRMRGTCIDITDRVLAEQDRERSAGRFRALVEASPDAILVLDGDTIVQANGRAGALLGGDPVGRSVNAVLPAGAAAGRGVPAVALDGRPLVLDVEVAPIEHEPGSASSAAFLRDAGPRLQSESLAATLREVQVRRRQALEINDNVVQGLTAALYALDGGEIAQGMSYLERSVSAARHMMNDWLNPPDGSSLEAGDLVRTGGSTLEAPVEAAPAPAVVDRPARPRPRIVVVDDNDDVRRLVRVQIERLGEYDVVGEAVDGVEAIEVVGALRPDVVFLDLAMPRMDGLEALPLLLDAAPRTRVVVLSGFDEGTIGAKAVAAGAARYVEKGLRLDFASIIEDVLEPPELVSS